MAFVVFLRGVNVGGHRRFRPALARELSRYEVVNVGAAGTLVVLKRVSRRKLLADLRRNLPEDVEVALCDGRDLVRVEVDNPFKNEPPRPDVVRFVSIFSKPARLVPSLPVALPPDGAWLVRVLGGNKRFVFGPYRRHMKTIGCLDRIDNLFGARATTRNWNAILDHFLR